MKLILSVIFFLSILFAGSIEKLLSINSNIFQAIKNNDLSAVKMILEKNINDLKVLNNNKYSPLHLASESGYFRKITSKNK